jgi:hypothetical protein
MRHCRIMCVILQYFMKQCGEVVIHRASPIVIDAQQQKGVVSVLTNLNVMQYNTRVSLLFLCPCSIYALFFRTLILT